MNFAIYPNTHPLIFAPFKGHARGQ